MIALHFIDTSSREYDGECELRYRVLRAPLGMRRDQVRFSFEEESWHFVAVDGDRVVGCVLFHPQGERGRLFQMAVDGDQRGRGIGRRLVERLEGRVWGAGVREIFLHARADAVGFYERLGYETHGEPFVEIGLSHRHMRKFSPGIRS